MRQWRDIKKDEWIKSLKKKGIEPDYEEIRKADEAGEPLEWEVKMIENDHETRKLILEILTQKNEIEQFARSHERSEDFYRDIRDSSGKCVYNIVFFP